MTGRTMDFGRPFVVVDASAMAFRVRHGLGDVEDQDDAVSLTIDSCLRAIARAFLVFKARHAVVCFDSKSWRAEKVKDYKADRKREGETEEQKMLVFSVIEALDEIYRFLREGTNATALKVPRAEADDLVARWTQLHPDYNHVIVSMDGDLRQLLADNVLAYDEVRGHLLLGDGNVVKAAGGDRWVDEKDRKVPHPSIVVRRKALLGTKDNLPKAAPPRVGEKKIEEALGDPTGAMLETMLATVRNDLPGSPKVREIYEANLVLSDLARQPAEIVAAMDAVIVEELERVPRPMVGMELLKLCKRFSLERLSDDVEKVVKAFSTGYG